MNNIQHRIGFTIIELTVTVLISSVLLSLAIPAVQRGRAKTRIVECKNNLKMIGLAMHNYHDIYYQFPPGWIGAKYVEVPKEKDKSEFSAGAIGNMKPAKKSVALQAVPLVDGKNHVTWQYFLLPLLEQGNMYDEMRKGLDTHQENKYTAWLKTPIDLYMCPDDTSDKTFEIKNDTGVALQVSRSNYGGNFGGKYTEQMQLTRKTVVFMSDCEPAKIPGQQCHGNGIFDHNGRLGIRDIIDGTTNTIMLAERVSFTVKNSLNKEEDYKLFWGYYLPNSKVAPGRFLFESMAPPNSGDSYGRFGSSHTGGAQACFADGSVRFITDKTDTTFIQSIGTRNGLENVTFND